MRDNDGPGPLTHGSVLGAPKCGRATGPVLN